MKNSIWKKGLTLALAAMVLTTSVSLPADAAEAAPVAETQETQPGGETAPAEESTPAAQVEEAAPATEAAGQTETITPETVQAAPAAEAAAQAGTGADKNTSGDDNSGSNSGNNTVNEKPNTSVTITPSNANALVLMDVGAQSPKGVPGDVVEVVLPIAVNREYLPSENYTLRNITIKPNISGSGGSSSSSSGTGTGSGTSQSTATTSWPFDVIDASYTRHLDDMSYNSTAEVWYKFRISEFAKKGVYPMNFTVNATVWRKDAANGTDITEDVTFTLTEYVTVVGDGELSGVVSNIGVLEIGGFADGAVNSSPVTSPGQSITLTVPLVNKGGHLSNITVSPVISGSLDEFPFVVDKLAYGISLNDMETGDTQNFTYTFMTSPYATTGNKPVTFRASYEENGITGECNFTAYIYVKDGYEDLSQMAPVATMKNWTLWKVKKEDEQEQKDPQEIVTTTSKVNVRKGMSTKAEIYKTVPANTQMVRLEQNEDQTWSKVQLSDEDTTPYYISSKYLVSSGTGELEHLEKTDYLSAGDEGVIRMTFINNSNERTIVDTAASIAIADPTALNLTTGSSDTAYLGVLKPGQTGEATFRVTVPAAAPVGSTTITVTNNYANTSMATRAVSQNIMIPIKQPMNVMADTPVIYGTPKTDEPFSVSLNIINKGRTKAYNLSITAMDGISMAETYYGGDVLPAGSLSADIEVETAKSGSFNGTLLISYEDSDGELYTQYVDLPVNVVQAVETMSEEVETEKKSGFPFWILILILLLLIAAGVAGYFLYKKKKAENGEETPENADGEDADWDEEDETDREGTETDSSEGDE
ncbi:hypothetical protein KFE18_10200 [Clostridiaceae bacterium Marseille-Q4143]|nr:hypothetical protein KFE18_10200 [Clostridiaceae bacterium Marseille-Q4143]